MTKRTVVALLLVSSPLLGQAREAPPHANTLATPAGKAVSEWLDAFNSADSTKLRAHYNRYQIDVSMAGQLAQRQQTGGYDLISIEKSTPRYIEFVLKARATGDGFVGVIELGPESSPGVMQATVRAIPSGKTFADFTIDSVRRALVINRAVEHLIDGYVFSEVAQKMAADVRSRFNRGEYSDVTNGITLAARLTRDFREVSKDKHLRVNFSADAGAPAPASSAPPSCGVTAALQPNGNVGVITIKQFGTLDKCGSEVTRAFEIVADADALIFDLRENNGGDPKTVAHISSYLFDERTHLNNVMSRRRDPSTQRLIVPDQFWTHPSWTHDVPGRQYGGTRPVYVLTSRLVFSAAEEFTYNLQVLKRATIVGEQTGGGAHLVRIIRIDEQFTISVPFLRSLNPITNTNWEVTGVTPHVKVPAEQAFDAALNLIAQKAKL